MSFQQPLTIRTQPVRSRAETRERGRARRRSASRSALATLGTSPRDPIGILNEQNADRVPELVPLRMERMLADPFAFYRGTAAIMAADLADCPTSGIMVAACGDAHVSNFGFYASPERQLVFDLNDFDEGALAPWEWDLKRLITSAVIGGRSAGYSETTIEQIGLGAVEVYVGTLRRLATLSAAERYFMHMNLGFARERMSKDGRRAMNAAIAGAEKRTAQRTIKRMTERREDGILQFVERPPTMVRFSIADALEASGPGTTQKYRVGELFGHYRSTVEVDIDMVLAQYEPRDLARRVVGVGSVGTRCYVQLLEGPDGDALILQIKEASESVLSKYGRIHQPPRIMEAIDGFGDGARVVGVQRILQAVSDPFLGYFRGSGRDYYVRQFHDMKGSIELEGLVETAFRDYVNACAIILGRAHGQSPTAGEIVGYVGRGDNKAARAILEWSMAYAEVATADFEAARVAFAPPDAAGTTGAGAS